MTARSFHLGDVLSLTTDRLVSPSGFGAVHELVEYMAGEPVWTHQIPRVADECKPSLLAQHPDLAAIEVPDFSPGENAKAEVEEWLALQVATFGDRREVEPLARVDHTSINPLDELAINHPDVKVVPVVLPDAAQ